MHSKYFFYGKQAIIKSDRKIDRKATDLIETELFEEVALLFLDFLREKKSPLLDVFPEGLSNEDQYKKIIRVMHLLSQHTVKEIIKTSPELKDFFRDTYILHQFVENLYNFWRNYERYFVCYSHNNAGKPLEAKPYRTFNDTIENLNNLVRKVYRDICENLTGDHPKIYRQMPAGCQVALIVAGIDWNCPADYRQFKDVYFIKQVFIDPPLIIDPPMNKRSGQFAKIDVNPVSAIDVKPDDWLCYPAKVGDSIVNLFFHNKFIGLGASLANLFDLATDEEAKNPDAIYFYGVEEGSLDRFADPPTVFFDDAKNKLLVGAVPRDNKFGYFGYVKKMMLTLHNVVAMKKGRMPIHGAMVKICLKNGKTANVVIVGDSGAGKSESLEAFRVLGDQYLRDMTVIFDDMGSIEISKDRTIRAYGTETGAFVRLDDLQPGFAFGNIDRSIIMSPQKINARALLPVTTLKEVLEGYPVDFFLYANNYEQVDDEHGFLEKFDSMDEAFKVFKKGARIGKGTTSEKGLTHTYFANIFGPVQYLDMHEGLAKKYFKALFKANIFVGQLRTRLAIEGYETKGPETASEALFKAIMEKK